MTRVKNGSIHRARRKKVMKAAKGYFGSKHRLYKTAKEQVMHSLSYAYRDRRTKKRDFRKLWITRINAACREHAISYSKFINGLHKAEVNVNRKMLATIAVDDPNGFGHLVEVSKDALAGKKNETVLKPTKATEKKTEKKTESKKPVDFTSWTVAKLKEEAKKRAISGYSTMKKAELLEALK